MSYFPHLWIRSLAISEIGISGGKINISLQFIIFLYVSGKQNKHVAWGKGNCFNYNPIIANISPITRALKWWTLWKILLVLCEITLRTFWAKWWIPWKRKKIRDDHFSLNWCRDYIYHETKEFRQHIHRTALSWGQRIISNECIIFLAKHRQIGIIQCRRL